MGYPYHPNPPEGPQKPRAAERQNPIYCPPCLTGLILLTMTL